MAHLSGVGCRTSRILYAGDLPSFGCHVGIWGWVETGLRRSSAARLRGVGRSAGAVGRTLGGGVCGYPGV
jgi:hypothetical protein